MQIQTSQLQALLLEAWGTKVIQVSRSLSPTPPGYSCSSGMAGESRFFSIADDARRVELTYYHPQRGPSHCTLTICGCIIPWERVALDGALNHHLSEIFSPILLLGNPHAEKVEAAIARFFSYNWTEPKDPT